MAEKGGGGDDIAVLKRMRDEEKDEDLSKLPLVDRMEFNLIICLCIVANAIVIGLETNATRTTGTCIEDRAPW